MNKIFLPMALGSLALNPMGVAETLDCEFPFVGDDGGVKLYFDNSKELTLIERIDIAEKVHITKSTEVSYQNIGKWSVGTYVATFPEEAIYIYNIFFQQATGVYKGTRVIPLDSGEFDLDEMVCEKEKLGEI